MFSLTHNQQWYSIWPTYKLEEETEIEEMFKENRL